MERRAEQTRCRPDPVFAAQPRFDMSKTPSIYGFRGNKHRSVHFRSYERQKKISLKLRRASCHCVCGATHNSRIRRFCMEWRVTMMRQLWHRACVTGNPTATPRSKRAFSRISRPPLHPLHRPSFAQIASMRDLVALSISIMAGHWRLKPSAFHLRVASMPILEP